MGGSLVIASPDRWLAGWGADAGELVADMLPDDPVLLPQQRCILDEVDEGVVWSPAQYEPASDTWHLGAYARSQEGDGFSVAIIRTLRLDDVLARAIDFQLPGAEAVIIDGQGRVLSRSRQGESWYNLHADLQLADSDDPALLALAAGVPFAGPRAELIADPAGDWLFGVSRLPEPGWMMVSIHPAALVDGPARSAALMILIGGFGLLLVQTGLLVLILRRRIAAPLRGLVQTAERIAHGERGIPLAVDRPDELGDLARAFTSMDQSISQGEERLRTVNAALREREELARALVASAADAVLLLADDRIVEANPRAGALFGLEPRDMLDRRLLDLAPAGQGGDQSSQALHDEHCRRAAAGETCQYPWRARRADGSGFEAEIGLARVDLPGPLRLLAVVRDVSERNRLQREMRQGEKMESVGQLAGGIAHDFNNLLSVILGAADLLGGTTIDSSQRRRLLDSIISTCERAGGLVSRLLTFARRSEPLTTAIDVHTLLEDVLTLLERSIDKRIVLQRHLNAASAVVVGDASQLENALLNLGLNARDAMPEGGTLQYASALVELQGETGETGTGRLEPGTYLHIAVHDTGCGMGPELIDRIFEPFFTTKPVGKGTGLGLAAVYRAVIDHRGGLTVESEPDCGTSFHIYLPLSQQPVAGNQTAATRPIHSLSGLVVLLVDDEDLVRSVARQILESFGLRVVEAEDGLQAVDRFRAEQRHIAVVLVDAEMPGLRGPDCLQALRGIDPSVKAILCSGFVRLHSSGELREAGFSAQLDKPYRIQQMRQVLEAVVFGESPD
jgi:PAS domain S-box-containing protein